MKTSQVITLSKVSKSYPRPLAEPYLALEGLNLTVQSGQMVAVLGKSGSGKSTLLNLITGIDQATSGQVHVGGQLLNELTENQLSRWRGRHVGIVFQFFQLMPTLTALENIVFAMDLVNAVPRQDRRAKAQQLLGQVGLTDQADKLPATLSGGQQQRVAIARALANNPLLLVADEPTGNLDWQTAETVLTLFGQLKQSGVTVLIVTHDEDIALRADRIIRLHDGRLVEDKSVAIP